MSNLARVLGLDMRDPETLRALALARADRKLLRSLIQLRIDAGLRQEDVATRLGLKQSTIAAFESHDNDPKLSTIRRYAQVVGALISHDVQPDRGQVTTGSRGWTGGWVSAGPATVVPSYTATVGGSRQAVQPMDNIRADFMLAA